MTRKQGRCPTTRGAFIEISGKKSRALAAEPLNSEALNLYAYAYRVWWLSLPKLPPETRFELADPLLMERVEERARKAVQLAQDSSMEGYRGIVESTLGEVLLLLGRPHEALTWLNQAIEHTPKHVRFTEIMRDRRSHSTLAVAVTPLRCTRSLPVPKQAPRAGL